MIVTWKDLRFDTPKIGTVALTYHPTRPGPPGVQYDVLLWCKGLGKGLGGGFGRMKVGKRSTTVEYIEPPPSHWAALSDENHPS